MKILSQASEISIIFPKATSTFLLEDFSQKQKEYARKASKAFETAN
jgi:hypothetical protein